MLAPTGAAGPTTHRQACRAVWASGCVAATALPRTACLVALHEPYGSVIALVSQHGSKTAPASVQHALGVRPAGQSLGIDVAHHDAAVRAHELCGNLVQEILPAIGNPGMDRLHTGLVAGALGARQSRLQIAKEAPRLDLAAIGQRGQILEPEIDADGAPRRRRGAGRPGQAYRRVQVPAPARILADAARAKLVLSQAPAVP